MKEYQAVFSDGSRIPIKADNYPDAKALASEYESDNQVECVTISEVVE